MALVLVSAINKLALYTVSYRCAYMTDKEHWEPMLCSLFKTQSTKSAPYRILEAWAFDCHAHRESALLNPKAQKTRPGGLCELASECRLSTADLTRNHPAIAEWSQALVAFVNSKYSVRRRLVVIGHGAGASIWSVQLRIINAHDFIDNTTGCTPPSSFLSRYLILQSY
jgi:hypothetical protein